MNRRTVSPFPAGEEQGEGTTCDIHRSFLQYRRGQNNAAASRAEFHSGFGFQRKRQRPFLFKLLLATAALAANKSRFVTSEDTR